MTELRRALKIQLKKILRSTFTVTQPDKYTIQFKSVKMEQDKFHLSLTFVTEAEVLEVAKILAEVYRIFPKAIDPADWQNHRRSVRKCLSLNLAQSGLLVGAVVSLDASALHKLLLLTSGNFLLLTEQSDLVISLAQNKKETCSNPEDMIPIKRIFSLLMNLYILPGVSVRTITPSYEPFSNDVFVNSSIELTSKLTAFFANNSETLTLAEHLKLDFTEAITTRKSLVGLPRVIVVQKDILISGYRQLAESMTAAELMSLSFLLDEWRSDFNFPENILRNRCKAMSKVERKPGSQSQSISLYLSDFERKSLSSPTVIQNLDFFLSRSRLMDSDQLPIVFAALAEVLAVKGERKAFDVVHELQNLKRIQEITRPVYEAAVAMIDEALKPENDDFPFSWVAQMSEHSWVLTSHIDAEELTLKM